MASIIRPGRALLAVCLVLLLSACASGLQRDLGAVLVPPEMEGVRWGILVSDLDGTVLVEQRADERFLPASNTKLFSTAAAFRWQAELDGLAPEMATRLYLEQAGESGLPSLVLVGRGDAGLKDGPDCELRCLSHFADAVVAAGLLEVGNVVGDDTWFPEERWPGGWSWEDLQTRYGTAVSALVLNDNVIKLTIDPADLPGVPGAVQWAKGDDYLALQSEVETRPVEGARLGLDKLPGEDRVRVHGHIHPEAEPVTLSVGVEDPAHFAAWRLAQLLKARGVQVSGEILARHRAAELPAEEEAELVTLVPDGQAETLPGERLAMITPTPWREIAHTINKDSQNLYAELLLRQLGRISAEGEMAAGLARIETMLAEAGVDPNGHDLFDGSGMSVYNRVSPRAIVGLLVWANEQEWGADWRATFPIGGMDGSLERRFSGSWLDGRIFAKTGTLKGTNALSGYMIARSGRILAFSIIANERPLGVSSAVPYMDQALLRIAEEF